MIDYPTFLANAKPADARAMVLLASGDTIKTLDPAEAEVFQAQGMRLFDAGVVNRFRRSLELIGGETWHVFDARVLPAALVYVADAAGEYLKSQQVPPAP